MTQIEKILADKSLNQYGKWDALIELYLNEKKLPYLADLGEGTSKEPPDWLFSREKFEEAENYACYTRHIDPVRNYIDYALDYFVWDKTMEEADKAIDWLEERPEWNDIAAACGVVLTDNPEYTTKGGWDNSGPNDLLYDRTTDYLISSDKAPTHPDYNYYIKKYGDKLGIKTDSKAHSLYFLVVRDGNYTPNNDGFMDDTKRIWFPWCSTDRETAILKATKADKACKEFDCNRLLVRNPEEINGFMKDATCPTYRRVVELWGYDLSDTSQEALSWATSSVWQEKEKIAEINSAWEAIKDGYLTIIGRGKRTQSDGQWLADGLWSAIDELQECPDEILYGFYEKKYAVDTFNEDAFYTGDSTYNKADGSPALNEQKGGNSK